MKKIKKIKKTFNFKKIYYSLFFVGILLPLRFIFAEGTTGIGIRNPIGVNSIQKLVSSVLEILVVAGTPIAVLFLIFSGFKFITAQGNSTKITEAKQYFMWTLVGIVILLGAEVLAKVVEGTIEQLGHNL